MVAVDIYVNETTRHADVILPPTTALERDHYDLVFHLLAVRNTARFTPAVFAKAADARHDWEIYREIALRMMARLRPQAAADASGSQARARLSVSPTLMIAGLLRRRRGRGDACVAAAQAARGRRPRAAAARPAARRLLTKTSGSTPRPAWCSTTWPGSRGRTPAATTASWC